MNSGYRVNAQPDIGCTGYICEITHGNSGFG